MTSPPTEGLAPSPGMTYQPLSPPALGYGLDDDDDKNRRWKLSIRMVEVPRLAIIPLSFANMVYWGAKGFDSDNGGIWVAYLFMYFAFFWNLALIITRSTNRKDWFGWLPAIVCKIGDFSCACNSNHDGYEPLRKPSRPRSKARTKLIILLTAVLDLGFGSTIVGITAKFGPRLPWYAKAAIIALNSVVGSFSIIAGLLTLADWNSDHILELGMVLRDHNDNGKQARIRLPTDTDDRRTASGTVSV